MYCKKLTSERNVIDAFTPDVEIAARVDPRKLLKFFDEMCLIKVTAFVGEVSPFDRLTLLKQVNNFLKFEDAGQHFRFYANALVEGADEVFVADAGFLCEPPDGEIFIRMPERLHGKINVRVGIELPLGQAEQKVFE